MIIYFVTFHFLTGIVLPTSAARKNDMNSLSSNCKQTTHSDQALVPFEEDPFTKGVTNAYMSLLAYENSEEEVNRAIKENCFQKMTFSETLMDNATGTYALVVKTGYHIITIAFQGTELENVRELFTDLDAEPITLDPGVKVHGGFAKAVDSIYDQVKDSLQRNHGLNGEKTIYITGHSLGCGLATIATYRLAQDYPNLHSKLKMYGYGCPIVANEKFNTNFNDFNIESYSFTLKSDPVSTGSNSNAVRYTLWLMFNVWYHKPPVIQDYQLPCPSGFYICHEILLYLNDLIKISENKLYGRCC